MREYALILISTVFVNNFVLVKFLGLCPFMGVSRKYGASFGMGLATTLVLMVTSALTYLTETYILAPLELTYLRTIAYIFVIALVVQTLEIVLKKTNPELYGVLGIYLPLITTNCIVLGLTLLNTSLQHNFAESVIYGLGGGLGFTLVILMFSAMRERLEQNDIPAPFRGAASGMIAAGIMSMAFMGFAGIVK